MAGHVQWEHSYEASEAMAEARVFAMGAKGWSTCHVTLLNWGRRPETGEPRVGLG